MNFIPRLTNHLSENEVTDRVCIQQHTYPASNELLWQQLINLKGNKRATVMQQLQVQTLLKVHLHVYYNLMFESCKNITRHQNLVSLFVLFHALKSFLLMHSHYFISWVDGVVCKLLMSSCTEVVLTFMSFQYCVDCNSTVKLGHLMADMLLDFAFISHGSFQNRSFVLFIFTC